MPKLRLIGLTLLALSATAVSHAEETRYVSDELNTWVRSGPGDHYRLVGTVNAGEEVTLLQTDANTELCPGERQLWPYRLDPVETT